MGCRTCGGVRRNDPLRRRVRNTIPDPGGVYELQEFEPCDERWSGPDFTVYIVGRGTPDESIFHESEFDAAAAFVKATGNNPHLFAASASQLCAPAVEELLDSLGE